MHKLDRRQAQPGQLPTQHRQPVPRDDPAAGQHVHPRSDVVPGREQLRRVRRALRPRRPQDQAPQGLRHHRQRHRLRQRARAVRLPLLPPGDDPRVAGSLERLSRTRPTRSSPSASRRCSRRRAAAATGPSAGRRPSTRQHCPRRRTHASSWRRATTLRTQSPPATGRMAFAATWPTESTAHIPWRPTRCASRVALRSRPSVK